MKIEIDMFGKTIEPGYILEIKSWENDADYPQTTVITGLCKEDAFFTRDFLSRFNSKWSRDGKNELMMGNADLDSRSVLKLFYDLHKKYPKSVEHDLKEYVELNLPLHLEDDEFDSWIETFIESDDSGDIENSLYEYLCGYVWYPHDYEYPHIRACESVKIFYNNAPIKIPSLEEVK